MEYLIQAIQIFLHLDKYLETFFHNYGILAYLILFLIIFAETGLVVTPFLPGDSLLFAAGALAASVIGVNLTILLILFPIAAILGNTTNYWLGYWLGPKVFSKEKGKILNKKHLDEAQGFYDKYGPIAITICRFFPIIRTITPFVAGIGKMNFLKYSGYNILGGLLWSLSFTLAGFFFGNIEIVKKNFTLVVMGIVVISVIPALLHVFKKKKA